MNPSLLDFLSMGGYAFYVWNSYLAVFILLALQWFIPWKRLRTFLNKNHHE